MKAKEFKKRKVKQERVEMVNNLANILIEANSNLENIEITNPENRIDFYIGEDHYWLDIKKERKHEG